MSKIILRVGIAAMAAILALYYINYKSLKNEHRTTVSILEEKEAEIKLVRTQNQRLKQEKQTAVISATGAKKAMRHYQEESRDLAENHEVKIRNLHTYYRAKISTSGSGQAHVGDTIIVVNKDSTGTLYPTVKIDDGYLSLNGHFTEDRYGASEFHYKYNMSDSISVAYHWTQKGIWPFRSNDKLMLSFSSQNPNTRLESVTSITVTDKKKTRFSVGPYVGYGISTQGESSIQIGVGVQYSLKTF